MKKTDSGGTRVLILFPIIFGMLHTIICAQDSIKIEHSISEIKIYGERISLFNIDEKQDYSKKKLNTFSSYDVGDILSNTSSATIASYGGVGGGSGISIRGSLNSHTAVLWNGFNINSLSLGEMDMSTLPVEAIDEIAVVSNGSATLFGSGTFGGAILMENKADWKQKAMIAYTLNSGSFKNQKHSVEFRFGNKGIQYSLKSFYQSAKNDFKYDDIYKVNVPETQQKNNALKNGGIIQNIHIKTTKGHFLELGNWYQKKRKEIPKLMGSFGESNQLQNDKAIRSYIQWHQVYKSGKILAKSAYIYEYFRYTDKANANDSILSIDSKIELFKSLTQVNYSHYFNTVFQGNIGAEFNALKTDNNNYATTEVENLGSLYIDGKATFSKTIITANARQDIDKLKMIRPLFSVGISHPLLNDQLRLNFSYADKYKKPSFNDRYWKGAFAEGNPNLIPEKGWGVEYGIEGVFSSQNNKHKIGFMTDFYYTKIKDGIIWTPDNRGIWSPKNLKKISLRGIENSLTHITYFKSNITLTNEIKYHFNNSQNDETGKSLIYRPKHQFRTLNTIEHTYFLLAVNWVLNSTRYTDESENESFALPYYQLLNIHLKGKYTIKNTLLELGLEVKNLTNTAYEIRRAYAQPGRAYYINFKINYLLKNQKK